LGTLWTLPFLFSKTFLLCMVLLVGAFRGMLPARNNGRALALPCAAFSLVLLANASPRAFQACLVLTILLLITKTVLWLCTVYMPKLHAMQVCNSVVGDSLP
jgi:hypothetical protein